MTAQRNHRSNTREGGIHSSSETSSRRSHGQRDGPLGAFVRQCSQLPYGRRPGRRALRPHREGLRNALSSRARVRCGRQSPRSRWRVRAPESAGHLGQWASLHSVKHCALARGCCAPLRTPGLSRRCVALDGRGRRTRTPVAVCSWRSGAPLWSPPTSRRQTSSPPPRRRPSGSPTSGSGPTRSSPASMTSSMPQSASRTTRPGAGLWPSRRDRCAPQGGWERPRPRMQLRM